MTPEQFATDPEVAAELAAEARERARQQQAESAQAAKAEVQAPVEEWPCRDCATPVPMTAIAIDLVRMANRALVALGAKPQSKREATLCPRCFAAAAAANAARERRRHESIAALTAELRHGTFPAREEQVVDELRGLGANVSEIKRRIAEERGSVATTKSRRTEL